MRGREEGGNIKKLNLHHKWKFCKDISFCKSTRKKFRDIYFCDKVTHMTTHPTISHMEMATLLENNSRSTS